MHPNGAKKNKLAQAIFSKEGPNLIKPAVTKSPRATPKIYKVSKRNIRGNPILKIETPNIGIAIIEAGTRPIKVLKIAVNVKAAIISLNLMTRKAKREERKVKQLIRANERLVSMSKEKITTLDDLPDELDELDPFLDETARITFDLISLGKIAKK